MSRALEIIRRLNLLPHPEGGHYAEVFRSPVSVPIEGGQTRSASTAIYFLLQTHEFSAFHRVRSDELWHHYLGDPLELHVLTPEGHTAWLLGSALEEGQRPLAVVPAGNLQAARPKPGPHGFTLVGCTVAPGFDFRDFEMPPRDELLRAYPQFAELVEGLTR